MPTESPYLDRAQLSQAVVRALKSGLLTKPKECEKCHAVTRVQAHHQDYSKPLQVEWLCSKCHSLHHSKLPDSSRALIADIVSLRSPGRIPSLKLCLTRRELQVVKLIVLGLSNVEIGAQLGIAKRTVETHRERIFRFARVHNSIQLVAWALKHGHATLHDLLAALSINNDTAK